jgi:hypothetical protein
LPWTPSAQSPTDSTSFTAPSTVLQADRNSIEPLIAKIVRSFFILFLRHEGRPPSNFDIFGNDSAEGSFQSVALTLAEAFQKAAGPGRVRGGSLARRSCFSLAARRCPTHITLMAKRSLYQRLRSNAQVRTALFALGVLLMLVGIAIGPLPGPGFLIVFPVGLMLCLQNSAWAKRVYVRFKRRHPRYAAWTDRVMQRPSAARRRKLRSHENLPGGD